MRELYPLACTRHGYQRESACERCQEISVIERDTLHTPRDAAVTFCGLPLHMVRTDGPATAVCAACRTAKVLADLRGNRLT